MCPKWTFSPFWFIILGTIGFGGPRECTANEAFEDCNSGYELNTFQSPLITSQNNTLVKAHEAYDLVKGKTWELAISSQKFSWVCCCCCFDEQTLIGKGSWLEFHLFTFCQNLSIFRTGNTTRLVVVDWHQQDSRSSLYWGGGRGSKQASRSVFELSVLQVIFERFFASLSFRI